MKKSVSINLFLVLFDAGRRGHLRSQDDRLQSYFVVEVIVERRPVVTDLIDSALAMHLYLQICQRGSVPIGTGVDVFCF